MRSVLQEVRALVGLERNNTSHAEKLISAGGAFLGILLVYWLSATVLSEPLSRTLLVASMGASAVLLFAVPHGALSQPWPVFGGNVLTTDPDMWMYMKGQVTQRPELALAGPSLGWLHAALTECTALSLLPAPDVPCVTWLGTSERVVDPAPVHLRMAGWRAGQIEMMSGAEHEIMMETHDRRAVFFDSAARLFRANP